MIETILGANLMAAALALWGDFVWVVMLEKQSVLHEYAINWIMGSIMSTPIVIAMGWGWL